MNRLVERFGFRISIRNLLLALVATAVVSTVAFSGAAILFSNRIADGQERLIGTAAVRSASGGMNVSLSRFLARQIEILAAEDSGSLEAVENRSRIEIAFAAHRDALLEAADEDAAVIDAMNGLGDAYAAMLEADAHVSADSAEALRLAETIDAKLGEIDAIVARMTIESEEISSRLTEQTETTKDKLREVLADEYAVYDPESVAALREYAEELTLGDQAAAIDANHEAQVGVVELAGLVSRFANARSEAEVSATRENEAARIVAETSAALASLVELLEDDASLAEPARELAASFDALVDSMLDAEDSIANLELRALERRASLHAALDETRAAVPALGTRLFAIDRAARDVESAATSQTRDVMNASMTTAHGLSIVVVALMLGLGIAVYRLTIRALDDVNALMEDIAQGDGDLTRRLDGRGVAEMQRLAAGFNAFVAKVQQLVVQIAANSDGFNASVQRAAAIAQQTNARSLQQQKEIDQVAASVSEMAASVENVASNTEHAAESARHADSQTASSKQTVAESLRAIQTISDKVAASSVTIQRLSGFSDEVGKVVDVIQAITEQTNLLALNAAIEAARAGDQGRGFAVVADEVRTLARRTQDSLVQIQEIVEQLQAGAKDAEREMREGTELATGSAEQASGAAQALDTITDAVATIGKLNADIARAAAEQATATEEISRNVENITGIAREATTGSQETVSACEQLADLSGRIHTAVGQFKV